MKKLHMFIYTNFIVLFFSFCTSSCLNPKISIITSVYAGDEFIDHFLNSIVQQTIFNQCELILINANSPGNEEPIIKKYMSRYPNIMYTKLNYDPGLYGTWNLAIQMSHGEYLTNANLDDRLRKDTYEIFSKYLDQNQDISLVYGDYLITKKANETFEKNSANTHMIVPEFSKKNMIVVLPNHYPMWRKSLHSKVGPFNARYKISGDWEMWLRAIKTSNAIFEKVNGIFCLNYQNPKGLSTCQDKIHLEQITSEKKEVFNLYKDILECKHLTSDQFVKERAKKIYSMGKYFQNTNI